MATWSLRERAVWSLPPTGPTRSVRRRSTAMWMSTSSGANGNVPPASSAATWSSPLRSGVALVLGDDPRRREHRRVRARLRDVMRPEPAVVADRGVELAEDRVVRLREARHGSSIMATLRSNLRALALQQHAPQELAGHRPRELVDRLDGDQLLVRRDALLDVLVELAGVARAADHDPRLGALAGALVGHAGHAGVGDRRVAREHGLELGGRDLEAADLDQLLEPAGERDVAVRVDLGEVAGVEPAVGVDGRRGGGRIAEVAVEDRRAANPQLARRRPAPRLRGSAARRCRRGGGPDRRSRGRTRAGRPR